MDKLDDAIIIFTRIEKAVGGQMRQISPDPNLTSVEHSTKASHQLGGWVCIWK
jgi:hypothetical protein